MVLFEADLETLLSSGNPVAIRPLMTLELFGVSDTKMKLGKQKEEGRST